MVRSSSSRTIGRVVRKAALGSYGVAAVRGPTRRERLLGWFGLTTPGVRVNADDGLHVEVNLDIAEGVPPAAVASNVTNAIRYRVQRDFGRTIDDLVVLVGGQPLMPAVDAGSQRGGRGTG